jgi:hypothetical protein
MSEIEDLRAEGLHPALQIGDRVGARCWPYSAAHPDCWELPLHGILLPRNEPRAWANTLAFVDDQPSQAAVDRHLQWCLAHGLLRGIVPVQWSLTSGVVIRWQSITSLVPAEEDLCAWVLERAARHAEASPDARRPANQGRPEAKNPSNLIAKERDK